MADRDQVRPVTALFADIVGSTALAEVLGIEEVKALIGECVTRMSEVVERYGGVIGSFMGDGIATFFGIDAASEDDQYHAALAALEMRRVIDEYAIEAKSAWGIDKLSVRIGINAGRVATGLVGGYKEQILALGDAVNVAARLQSIAEPGSIVVGESVARVLSSRFEMTQLGPVQLRGRRKRVQAYVLLAKADVPKRRSQPVVGRESDLARVEELVAEAVVGRGQIGLVLGDAGIGKTRLLEETRSRAGSAVLWLSARSSAGERRLPYEPFVEILRSWLGVDARSASIAVRVRLKARLSEVLGDGAHGLVAPLSRFLGLPARTKVDAQLDDLPVDVSRAALHDAYVRWIRALASKVPLVLAIDGFGDIDESTVQLGEAVLAVTDEVPLCVLVTMRPESSSPIWRMRVRALAEFAHRTAEVRLEALSISDSERFLAALDESGALTPVVRSKLTERAEGNPLYLEELFNAVAGDLSENARHRPRESELPIALEGLLLSRIDQLPTDSRCLLQAAAVLGREFSKQVLQDMNVCEDFSSALATLIRADLIRERRREPAEFSFKHGLLRDAALSTLTEQRLRVLHGLAGKSIESSYAASATEHSGVLAWHYLCSGERSKAVSYLEGFGERLMSVYKYDQAIDVLEDCRRHVPREKGDAYRRVTKKLAELRARIGDLDGATSLLDDLISSSEGNEKSALLALKAQIVAEAGHIEAATELVRECLTLPAEQQVVDRLTTLAAQLCLRRQDLLGAKSCLEALGVPERLAPETGFDAASLWAGYLVGVGDFTAAKPWGERAVALAQKLGKAGLEFRSTRQLGLIHLLNGRVRAGHALLRDVFDKASQLDFAVAAVESGVNLVHAACLLGEIVEAERVSKLMMGLTESPFWIAHIRSNLSTISFERGDLATAEELASQVLEAGIDSTSPAPRIAARTLLARVRMAERAWKLAERELSLAEQDAGPIAGRRGLAMMLRTYRGELAWRSGDWDSALTEADLALEESQRVEKPAHIPALRLKGTALCHLDRAEGLALLNDVSNMARVMEMKLEEARTLVAIGTWSTGISGAHLDRAEALFRRCGSRQGLREISELEQSTT
jgi:class 3 adenylate cyclase